MRYFNDYGPPYSYSDALYHSGIPGMKWGVRRFQNLDRTWTEEGKIRYGSASRKAGETVAKAARSTGRAVATVAKTAGRGVKGAGKFAVKRFKMKHPWAMTDAEVKEYTNRMANEMALVNAKRALAQSGVLGKTRKFIGDTLMRGASTIADAGFRKLAEELTKDSDDRRLEELTTSNKILEARKNQKKLVEELTGKSNRESIGDLFERAMNNPKSLDDEEWKRLGAVASSTEKAKGFIDNFLSGKTNNSSSSGNDKNKRKPDKPDSSDEKEDIKPETPASRLNNLASQVQQNSFLRENETILNAAREKAFAPSYTETNRFSNYKMPSDDYDRMHPSYHDAPKVSKPDPYEVDLSFSRGINTTAAVKLSSGDSFVKSIVDDTPMTVIDYYTDDYNGYDYYDYDQD